MIIGHTTDCFQKFHLIWNQLDHFSSYILTLLNINNRVQYYGKLDMSTDIRYSIRDLERISAYFHPYVIVKYTCRTYM